jgi:hypothetical protein
MRGRTSSVVLVGEVEGAPEKANEGRAENAPATETFRRKSRRAIKDSAMKVLAMRDWGAESQREDQRTAMCVEGEIYLSDLSLRANCTTGLAGESRSSLRQKFIFSAS